MVNYSNIPQRLVCTLIRLYQCLISPILGPHCRFYPSCSHYSLQAIKHYGLLRGLYLSVRRLSKCHPWHVGGIDEIDRQLINVNNRESN